MRSCDTKRLCYVMLYCLVSCFSDKSRNVTVLIYFISTFVCVQKLISIQDIGSLMLSNNNYMNLIHKLALSIQSTVITRLSREIFSNVSMSWFDYNYIKVIWLLVFDTTYACHLLIFLVYWDAGARMNEICFSVQLFYIFIW